MLTAIFNLCNKNLILFVINSIILKAFRKLYSTQQIMLVCSLSALCFFLSGMLPFVLNAHSGLHENGIKVKPGNYRRNNKDSILVVMLV